MRRYQHLLVASSLVIAVVVGVVFFNFASAAPPIGFLTTRPAQVRPLAPGAKPVSQPGNQQTL
jgi:hypothetical protein